MDTPKTELPQGTLDLLVLQVAAHGPIDDYGIAQRIKQVSRDVLRCAPSRAASLQGEQLIGGTYALRADFDCGPGG